MSKLTVAGIGPGEADYILPAVIKFDLSIRQCMESDILR